MTDAWLAVALIALAGCPARQDVECVDDTSCDLAPRGACVANPATGNRWCSYPDVDCASGSRWSDVDVGDGVGGTCTATDPYAGGYAFVSRRDFDAEIYVMAADGSQPRNLTGDPGDDTEPRWSPDGSHIAFVSTRTGVPELYVMVADGSGAIDVSHGDGSQAAWSPDGTTLLFSSKRSGPVELYSVAADGSSPPERVTFGGGEAPAWAPDGNRFAFVRVGIIIVARRDGSNLHRLTTGVDSEPSWSPDGSRIAYVHGALTNIRVVDVDGGDPFDLTPLSSQDSHPVWSPDGARIALLRGDTATSSGVYVVNLDRMDIEAVATFGRPQQPAWTLDGTAIVFASSVTTDLEIVQTPVVGGAVTNLTNHPGDDLDATPRPSR